jgi:choline monooxygenase
MPIPFPFDPDITRAETLPARLYVDPVWYALEQERVFARTWQLVGHTAQVQTKGDFFTAEIGHESIVILHDGHALRGFHNVCLHRAGPVASGCGRRQTLQCRYHGWTYALDGTLTAAPEMEGAERFDPRAFRLQPVQVAHVGPLVFACLDLKAPPLAHFLDGIAERTASLTPDRMRWVLRRDYEVACNWKVYVDNFLEGYHLPVVHPQLYKELDYDAYRVEPHRYWSLQHAPLRPLPPDPARAAERRYVPGGAGTDAQYYWCFPNVMLNIYLGQMQTNAIIPLGPDRTRTVFEWYATEPPVDWQADDGWRRLVAFSDAIQREDIEIVEAVQRNLRSRIYDRGRYAPRRENGVHHFHALLHEFLS